MPLDVASHGKRSLFCEIRKSSSGRLTSLRMRPFDQVPNPSYNYCLLKNCANPCSGLKIVNNWPTFPQFIVNGEFIGGLDVVVDMVENGEFAEVVAQGA
jgi:hypothetical protein